MDVIQAIRERRSIRKYTGQPVPEEALNAVLEAARWAPSWGNTQSWRLIVVRDREMRSKLAAALRSSRPGATKNAASDAVASAPVVIVACARRRLAGFYRSGDMQGQPATDKGEWWFMFDLGLAMQNLTLAAHALGLGAVHVGMFDPARVARLLGVPDDVAVVEIMPLGYPDEQPPIRPREELAELAFPEKWPAQDLLPFAKGD